MLVWDRLLPPCPLQSGRKVWVLPSTCCVPLGTLLPSLSPGVTTFQNQEFSLDKTLLSVLRVRFSLSFF